MITATILAFSQINVELRHNGPDIGIYMVGNGVDLVSSMEVAIDGDIAGVTNEPFLLAFPPFPVGPDCNTDLTDGGIWVGLVPGGDAFAPSSDGSLVATVNLNDCGYIAIPLFLDGCVTVVWDGTIPNTPVTGTLTGTNTADYNDDGKVDITDFLIVLAAPVFLIDDLLCVLEQWTG